jgi:hypothetical protein
MGSFQLSAFRKSETTVRITPPPKFPSGFAVQSTQIGADQLQCEFDRLKRVYSGSIPHAFVAYAGYLKRTEVLTRLRSIYGRSRTPKLDEDFAPRLT